MKRLAFPLLAVLFTCVSVLAQQKTVTIATVNNPDMIELKKLSPKFEEKNPDIKLNWVIVEENVLRQRVTTDVSTGSGQFDIVFIGLYETPIFAKRGWLRPMGSLPADFDLEDVFKSLRDGLSYEGKLYALPFYGESSMLMYRKDLLEEKGLKMPDQPKYEDIKKIADALTDKSKGFGLPVRGSAYRSIKAPPPAQVPPRHRPGPHRAFAHSRLLRRSDRHSARPARERSGY